MTARFILQERRRQAARARRRIIWGCIHAAIFAVSVSLIMSRAEQIQAFVKQVRGIPGEPQVVQVQVDPVELQPPAMQSRERPEARVSPPTFPGTQSRPVSSVPSPPERSLADLLEPEEEPEELREWRLVFDFESGGGSAEIPSDVDLSTIEIDRAEGVSIDEDSEYSSLTSGRAVRRIGGAEAVELIFEVEPADSPGGAATVTMRAMSRNLEGKEVRFRRRVAEAAIRAQTRVVSKATEHLAVAVAQHQKVTAWLNSTGTKALAARGAAKNQEAALERTIAGLRTALATQQQILLAYQESAKLGESIDGSATFVIQERPAGDDNSAF